MLIQLVSCIIAVPRIKTAFACQNIFYHVSTWLISIFIFVTYIVRQHNHELPRYFSFQVVLMLEPFSGFKAQFVWNLVKTLLRLAFS